MTIKSPILTGLFLCLCFSYSIAQEQVIAIPGLFRDALPPQAAITPYPENSGFITVNSAVFSAASSHAEEIFTIENFPLGHERVTLHVEQFDVIGKNSRLVLATKNGEVRTAAPQHIL